MSDKVYRFGLKFLCDVISFELGQINRLMQGAQRISFFVFFEKKEGNKGKKERRKIRMTEEDRTPLFGNYP